MALPEETECPSSQPQARRNSPPEWAAESSAAECSQGRSSPSPCRHPASSLPSFLPSPFLHHSPAPVATDRPCSGPPHTRTRSSDAQSLTCRCRRQLDQNPCSPPDKD